MNYYISIINVQEYKSIFFDLLEEDDIRLVAEVLYSIYFYILDRIVKEFIYHPSHKIQFSLPVFLCLQKHQHILPYYTIDDNSSANTI